MQAVFINECKSCEISNQIFFYAMFSFSKTKDLNIPLLRAGVMQVVFINECKSCEISNQMFFYAMFSFSETKDELVMT